MSKKVIGMKEMIPSLGFNYYNVSFEGMNDFDLMEKAQRNQIAVKLQGPTGSGKTTLAEAFCQSTEQPHFVMNMKGSTTSEELVGAFVPNTDENANTPYVWKDGIIVRALKYSQMYRETNVTRTTKGSGKKAQVSFAIDETDKSFMVDKTLAGLIPEEDIILIKEVSKSKDLLVEELTVKEWPRVMLTIEEINFSPEELMSVWFSLLDARRNIVLNEKDGEVIKAGKFLSVNATMNPDYVGTNQLNDALNDRFLIKLNVDYSVKTENQIISELCKKYGFTVNDVMFLKEFVKRVRNGKKEADCDSNISTRAIGSFLETKGIFGDGVAKESLLNAVQETDRDFVSHMYKLSKDSAEEIELDDVEMEGIDLSTFKGYEPQVEEKKNKSREEKSQEAVDEDVPF
jgi:MoxR-like ATPase